jgi:hypothetical protein
VSLPWSPTYVRHDDRAVERAVGRLLEELGYEVQYAKDRLSRWDLRARHRSYQPPPKKRPWIYAEVKHPNIDWEGRFIPGKFKAIPINGPFITASKADTLLVISGKQEAVVHNGNTQGPVWVIVVPNDLVARFAWLSAAKLATYVVDTKDTNIVVRQRGDLKDRNIAKYVVPFEDFHILGPVVP